MRLLFSAMLCAVVLCACSDNSSPEVAKPASTPPSSTPEVDLADTPAKGDSGVADPHSFANPDRVLTTHLDWDVDVDFDEKIIRGTATLSIERVEPDADEMVLDTRALSINAVRGLPSGEARTFTLEEEDPALGSALRIEIGEGDTAIAVDYQTSPEASGLQWLDPVQTAGGEHPFLFTQAQAIHARSFIPLQDTPQVRITYDATVRTPENLRAVMSAANDPETPVDGEYTFSMPQAIPSYLIAIGVGDLAFQGMSDRTGVYAEPSVVESAAYEFADTERMIEVSETLFGPYRWGRYDLLILPPSFPFGGMENPRLSFITPTVIAGDRSLVALIAHELAHSWSGNLVTNASWEDLWLNEGFTVYLESRIMEAVFGPQRKAMEDVLGYQSLQADFEQVSEGDARLVPDLSGRDPDDAFSNVPYEKGRLLLVYLEDRFGRETFDTFLRTYFDAYAFESLSTDEFLTYLDKNLLQKHSGKVSLDTIREWIDRPGLPEGAVLPSSDTFARVDAVRGQFLEGSVEATDLPSDQWTVHEWLYFLNNFGDALTLQKMKALDDAHALTTSRNAEIAHSWYRLAIEQHYEPALPSLRQYLHDIGRRKLIVPLYRDLMDTDWGKPVAMEVYAKARPGYHPLAQGTLDDIVK